MGAQDQDGETDPRSGGPESAVRPSGLIGVGYEGRTVDDLTAQPVAIGVSRAVDVRLNPISHKPGLSKTALGRALTAAGIAYEHHRDLGNPKANRAGLAGSGEDRRRARDHYVGLLGDPTAGNALDAVADAARRELVAVLCFEADQSRWRVQPVVAFDLVGSVGQDARRADDVDVAGS
jgi:uncharacterized protein (DUF488 family)